MDKIELEYADYCIETLYKSFDRPVGLKFNYKTLKDSDTKIVKGILKDEGWIKKYKTTSDYVLMDCAISVLKEHGSYSNFCRHNERIESRKKLKERFDFNVSKWKYYTFWPFFALAIFGGGYSIYDIIINQSQKKNVEKTTSPKVELKSELPKQPTLFLEQKNSDTFSYRINY